MEMFTELSGWTAQAGFELTAVVSLRLEGEDVRRTLQTSERRRATEGKIAVIGANIQYSVHAL